MPTGKRIQYVPGAMPSVLGPSLLEFLRREFRSIASSLEVLAINLQVLHAEPDKPSEGMLRYADGVDWNPGGGGKGVYVFDGTTWVKL